MTPEEIDFIEDEIALARHLESLGAEERIAQMCKAAGCNDKKRKIHGGQYLHKQWNPHPSARFSRWWSGRGLSDTEAATDRGWNGIDAVRAYNCEAVREVYREFLQRQRREMRDFRESF